MRVIKITIVIVVTIIVWKFIQAGDSFHPARILPFCDGEPVNIYHWAGLVMAAIFLWGLYRLGRRSEDDE